MDERAGVTVVNLKSFKEYWQNAEAKLLFQ